MLDMVRSVCSTPTPPHVWGVTRTSDITDVILLSLSLYIRVEYCATPLCSCQPVVLSDQYSSSFQHLIEILSEITGQRNSISSLSYCMLIEDWTELIYSVLWKVNLSHLWSWFESFIFLIKFLCLRQPDLIIWCHRWRLSYSLGLSPCEPIPSLSCFLFEFEIIGFIFINDWEYLVKSSMWLLFWALPCNGTTSTIVIMRRLPKFCNSEVIASKWLEYLLSHQNNPLQLVPNCWILIWIKCYFLPQCMPH